ncbi:hypothetical protein [Pseudonocardia alaniniphila]|uniref:Uncharacterized protein n=1 Tax=Pseudonocardia alaniniphila TaxID=75291 RepID=A0ABS9TDU6_9PSEU|nr:hypothetical protein [Pseudonocardia alaniniphila]MCH6166568.1 hypothetical protein [Pseudonocardia alaniniphila]
MPDRYVDAVRARRAELRAERNLLTGDHRAELRSCLALSRIAASTRSGEAFACLAREAADHVEAADRTARQRLPALLATAVHTLAMEVHGGWANALRPALRRIAAERDLTVDLQWPRLPAPLLPVVPTVASMAAPPRSLLAGAAAGAAVWRLALFPLAVLPLLGLPVLAGPALAALAIAAGVAAVVATARARRAAAERARLRRHIDQSLASAALAVDADLGRRLVELERAVVPVLDAAVLRRRAAVDAELALLAPAPAGEGSRG